MRNDEISLGPDELAVRYAIGQEAELLRGRRLGVLEDLLAEAKDPHSGLSLLDRAALLGEVVAQTGHMLREPPPYSIRMSEV